MRMIKNECSVHEPWIDQNQDQHEGYYTSPPSMQRNPIFYKVLIISYFVFYIFIIFLQIFIKKYTKKIENIYILIDFFTYFAIFLEARPFFLKLGKNPPARLRDPHFLFACFLLAWGGGC